MAVAFNVDPRLQKIFSAHVRILAWPHLGNSWEMKETQFIGALMFVILINPCLREDGNTFAWTSGLTATIPQYISPV